MRTSIYRPLVQAAVRRILADLPRPLDPVRVALALRTRRGNCPLWHLSRWVRQLWREEVKSAIAESSPSRPRVVSKTPEDLEFLRALIQLHMTLKRLEQTHGSVNPFLALLLPLLEDTPRPASGLTRDGRPPAPLST
jgi:hypothetical protein